MMQEPDDAANQLLTLPSPDDAGDVDLGGPPSPPWWRRRGTIIGIAIALLVILLGGLIFSLLNRRQPVNYQYQQVQTGTLSITVTATGPLTSGVYDLIFNGLPSSTVIDSINVKEGQRVVKGQVLATLDKTSLQDAYNEQLVAVQSAQNALNGAMNALAKTQALINANNSAAQTTLNGEQNNLNATKNFGQASVNLAQQTLNNDERILSATQRQGNASVQQAQTTLNQARNVLNKTQAQANATKALALQQEQQALANCNATPTATPTPGTGSSSPNCRQIAIDTYNQTVAQANLTVQQAQATVNNDQKALNDARATANLNNQTAQARVNADQKSLAQAQAQANQNNTAAQGLVNNDQANINTTQANGASTLATEQETVITDQNTLNSAQSVLAQDLHNLNNAVLRAPHDGIVTVVNGTVGGPPGLPKNATTSSTTTSGNTFIQIVDTSTLQVQANVNETDAANLKQGDQATFTVNAYSNRQFRGTVASISPLGQTVSNVVTFPVYINIDKNSTTGANLIPGMTANVTITVINRPNALLIPVDAINFARNASTNNPATGIPQLISSTDAANAMSQARQMLINLQNQNPSIISESPTPAYVIEAAGNNRFVAKPVVLGLTDGTVYEVLAGLTTGDTIVTGIASRTPAGNPGGGGGAGG